MISFSSIDSSENREGSSPTTTQTDQMFKVKS